MAETYKSVKVEVLKLPSSDFGNWTAEVSAGYVYDEYFGAN